MTNQAPKMTMESAVEVLKRQGCRITPQRIMILEYLLSTDDHVTAEELYERVKQMYPHISFSTVYRTLELLRDAGLITQTDLGKGTWSYHPIDRADHHHLICLGCGEMWEIPQDTFDEVHRQIMERYNFDALMVHYAIYGHCERCR